MTEIYALITEKILNQSPIPSGEEGYYFAVAHRTSWWSIMDGIAKAMHRRGLVKEPTAQVWPSHEMAAESLQFPVKYVRVMGPNELVHPIISTFEKYLTRQPDLSADVIPVNTQSLGWQPKWDEKRFLQSLDQEVQDVLDFDTVKPTLFNTVMSS